MGNENLADEQLIELYFNHPELAYDNWYKKMMLTDVGAEAGELVIAIPSIEEIINKFKLWYAEHIKLIKKCICDQFHYVEKKQIAKKAVELAVLMVPFVKEEFAFYCELAVIFILSGFEKTCMEEQNKPPDIAHCRQIIV